MLRNIVIFLLFHILFTHYVAVAGESAGKVLTLSECVQIALETNPRGAISSLDREEQEANLSSARKDLLPSLWFEYAYTRQPSGARPGIMSVPENYYNYSFTVEQPLFQGRSLVSNVEKNKLAVRGSEFAVAKTNSDIVLEAHQAYFGLLRAMKLEEETIQAVKRLEKHREDTNNNYLAGLVPKNDLLQSEVELAHGKQLQLKARNFRLLSATKLNLLLRLPSQQEIFIEDTFDYTHEALDWESVLAQALSLRPEVKQAEIAVQQAEKDIVIINSDFLPKVSLSATYEKQGDSPDAEYYPPGTSEIKTAQALAQWKLWSWGQGNDKKAAATRRLNKKKKEIERLSDDITLQLRESYLNLEESAENIGVSRKAVEQAEENYRLNEERYLAQIATSTEVLDAQTLLARSRISYYNAIYDYNLALAALRWASGTLTDN